MLMRGTNRARHGVLKVIKPMGEAYKAPPPDPENEKAMGQATAFAA